MWHRELGMRALEQGYAQDPLRMAAAFAALSLAYADAHIACWDAKYHYWYIRPSQADLQRIRAARIFPSKCALHRERI